MDTWTPPAFIDKVYTPQLTLLHRGKVRDSFALDGRRRLIVVTDRISAFDLKIKTPVPGKGEILNRLAAFWFERTADIVPNHVVAVPDGQAMVVRECEPIRVEMVVRGAICGTLWRAYKAGRRTFSGVQLPEGLTENAQLPEPIITPTTKEDSDREVTPAECIELGLVTAPVYAEMDRASRALFAFGQTFAAERGLLLADTKYEFGLCDGKLVLIDEIHTPDSSRFFDREAWQASPSTVGSYDKEFVRKWMRANAVDGRLPLDLPADVVRETAARYAALYQRLTGTPLATDARDPQRRLLDNLVAAGVLRDGYVAIVMGSRADLAHAETIAHDVRKYGIFVDLRVLSAHKNGDRAVAALVEYNHSLEPGCIVAIAGESNGLGGALAAGTCLPVINCPPFRDDADYLVNIHSSLRMPRHVPAATVVKPALAAQAAVRSLNLPRLRAMVLREVDGVRAALASDDADVRGKGRAQ